nr:hypothetical protein GCM10025699_23200 [Microbacterium flavescens]
MPRPPLLGEPLDPLAVVVELGQPGRPGVEQGDRVVEGAVRPDERRQHRPSLFDRGQLVRAGLVEVGEVPGQRGSEIGRAVAEVGNLTRQVFQDGIVCALERAPRLGEQGRGIRLLPSPDRAS